jgi:hypothetical protein
MLRNRKKASVLLQGWFVFLLFLSYYHHYQNQMWWKNKATQEFNQAKEIVTQHISIIETLRRNAKTCDQSIQECHIQRIETNQFKYEIEFDLQNYQVIEINIINH